MRRPKIATIAAIAAFFIPSFFIIWKNQRSNTPSVMDRDYIFNFSQKIKAPIQCVPYRTIRGKIPICVHDNPKEFITRYIRATGVWEGIHTKGLQDLLVANPDHGVIDIGANLGMFSVLAANLNRPALAVEALDVNIEKFHQTIVINRFEKYITLVTSPLSDQKETLLLQAKMINLGLSRIVKKINDTAFKVKTYHEKTKQTLLLDDLIDLVPWKKAIMVIDVEGNEGKIIRGGEEFFDSIDISHIFMEWIYLLPHEDKEYIVEFLSDRGYKPYASPLFKNELNCSEFTHWPTDIFWEKQ